MWGGLVFCMFYEEKFENTGESVVSAMWEHGGPVEKHKCFPQAKLAYFIHKVDSRWSDTPAGATE